MISFQATGSSSTWRRNSHDLNGVGNSNALQQNVLARCTVAVNNCKDFLKSHKRLERPLEQEVEGARAIFSGRIQSPDGALADGEFGLQVIRALERMDPRFRIPLLLKDVMGLSYKEMKQVLDQKIPTLKSRVIRARVKLRAVLARKNRR